jgi:hypothetical protein
MQENKKPSGTLEDISRKVATPPHLLPLATFVTMFSRLHCLYILTYYGGSRAELGSQTVRCGVLLLPCVRLAFVTLSPRATAPDDDPSFIVLTETKFSFRCIPVSGWLSFVRLAVVSLADGLYAVALWRGDRSASALAWGPFWPPVPACGRRGRLVGAGSGSHCGVEFGRSRTGEGSSGGRKRGVV